MTTQSSVVATLRKLGPSRTKNLIDELKKTAGISEQAARQRCSRAGFPVERLTSLSLPKGEIFFYLSDQHKSEQYWNNLMRDLRSTSSVFACAIDALDARGGVVPVEEFGTISGAPIALRKQTCSHAVQRSLVELGAMKKREIEGLGSCYEINSDGIATPLNPDWVKSRRLAERWLLDLLRQWLRSNRLGSFHKIAIRGEDLPLMVGQFQWDLTGPCYLRCLRTSKFTHGFVVADVFAEGHLDVHQIRHFIRKVQIYEQTSNSGRLLPILLGEGFTSEALSEGGKNGVMLVTPESLFGLHVAKALSGLIRTINQVAYLVANDSDQLFDLLDQVSKIEGRSLNMRGIMFELLSAYVANRIFESPWIDVGVKHTNSSSGKRVEMDLVCTAQHTARVIECKGLSPNGTVTLDDVEKWLEKLPTIREFLSIKFSSNRNYDTSYELWTTGQFDTDALDKLKHEKCVRVKHSIEFRDGAQLRKLAVEKRLTRVVHALDEHFLKHPLSDAVHYLAPTREQLNFISTLRNKIALLTSEKNLIPCYPKNLDQAKAVEYIRQLKNVHDEYFDKTDLSTL